MVGLSDIFNHLSSEGKESYAGFKNQRAQTFLTDTNWKSKTVAHEINLFVNSQHLNNTFIIYCVVDCFFELPQSQYSGTAHPGVFKQKCNFTVSVSSFKVFMILIDHKHNLSVQKFSLKLN